LCSGNWAYGAVVRFSEAQLGLLVAITTAIATFTVLAGAATVASTATVAPTFSTTFAAFATAFSGLAFVAWSVNTFGYSVTTAFCPGLLIAFTGFMAFAAATSATATTFTGSAFRALLLAMAIRPAGGWAA
jgi:hypothetical protein